MPFASCPKQASAVVYSLETLPDLEVHCMRRLAEYLVLVLLLVVGEVLELAWHCRLLVALTVLINGGKNSCSRRRTTSFRRASKITSPLAAQQLAKLVKRAQITASASPKGLGDDVLLLPRRQARR